MTVAGGAAQHGGAGQMQLARLQHDRLVQRQLLELVVLAEEDAQQHRVAWDLHGHTHFIVFRLTASA